VSRQRLKKGGGGGKDALFRGKVRKGVSEEEKALGGANTETKKVANEMRRLVCANASGGSTFLHFQSLSNNNWLGGNETAEGCRLAGRRPVERDGKVKENDRPDLEEEREHGRLNGGSSPGNNT